MKKRLSHMIPLLSLLLWLPGCKHTVDTSYLNTTPLEPLTIPDGLAMPQADKRYRIPEVNQTDSSSTSVDLSVPLKPLALLSTAPPILKADRVIIPVDAPLNREKIWEHLTTSLTERNISFSYVDQAPFLLITSLPPVNSRKNSPKFPRGSISLVRHNQQWAIEYLPLDEKHHSIADANAISLLVAVSLEKAQQKEERRNELLPMTLTIEESASGEFAIWTRTKYDQVWLRLPNLLKRLGFSISTRNATQGSLKIKFNPKKAPNWAEMGLATPEFSTKEYVLQVGDSVNRTSLQFLDAKEKSISEAALAQIFPAIQAVFAQEAVASPST